MILFLGSILEITFYILHLNPFTIYRGGRNHGRQQCLFIGEHLALCRP